MSPTVDPTPLFAGLIDDAAVFPPGLAPLDTAVLEHLDRRTHPHASCVGPLLVPAAAAEGVRELAERDERTSDAPLRVALVVRPGTPATELRDAVEALRDTTRVEVTGIELGFADGWQEVLDLEVPVAVEVGLGDDQAKALEEIADAVDEGADVVAKFRTGATDTWAWPDEQTLAGFLDAVVLAGLPFRLTGGLHHAIRGTYDGEPMHGLLNVVVATHEALHGAESEALAVVLAMENAELLTGRVARFSAQEAAGVRASFTAYGCCGVLDPIEELEALGLLTPTEEDRP